MIALHEPRIDQTDIDLVVESLKSSWVSTGGPFVDQFEKELAAFTDSKFAVSVSSGTVGLHLVLELCRRQRSIEGKFEVIMPTLSFIATANAIVHAGGNPVFVDVGSDSMNISVNSIIEFVESHYILKDGNWFSRSTHLPLLSILPVHVMGWAADLERLAEFCSSSGIYLVEDAAESLGVRTSSGRHVGYHGKAAVFSFNGNKVMTTGGGGMIVTQDEKFARQLKHLSTTAKTDAMRFEHDEVGYNYRLVNVLAALGVSQLRKLPTTLQRKKEIFEHYSKHLSHGKTRVHVENGVQSNYWLTNAVFESEPQRESALMHLLEANIQARPLWTPCHLQKAFKAYPQPRTSFSNSLKMWKTCLSLPSSPHLTYTDLDRIIQTIHKSVEVNSR